MDLVSLFNLFLLAFGFGFVIFWHELGHFLAAKWAGVRVEQFAVGFGNAIVSWRQGLGFRRGTSVPEYQARLAEQPDVAISPTEYRLNWLPLGGYVKMLGQEDLAVPEGGHQPDSYQNKPVGKRMIIISAGVVMNVILAAVLFTLLYFVGFTATAPKVGQVVPGLPAEQAGVQVGDEILSVGGKPMHDYSKLRLGVALLDPDESADFVVKRRDGSIETLQLQPVVGEQAGGMLQVGVLPMPSLEIPRSDEAMDLIESSRALFDDESLALLPGESVVMVDNMEVGPSDFAIYARCIDKAAREGRGVTLVVREPDGETRREVVMPRLSTGTDPHATTQFAGFRPLMRVIQVTPTSLIAPGSERDQEGGDILEPGDVILGVMVSDTGDYLDRPTREQLSQWLNTAGQGGRTVTLVVDRDGQRTELTDLPLTPLGGGFLSRLIGNVQYGLGALLVDDVTSTRIAAVPQDESAAASLDLATFDRIAAVDGEEVDSFYDVHRLLLDVEDEVVVTLLGSDGSEDVVLSLNEDAKTSIARADWIGPVAALVPGGGALVETTRRTANPLQAIWWGVHETRDQIVNLYLTLRRVTVDRTVSPTNLSGPVGILHFGTIVAAKGYDWLIWFLAMLSANLAVVNFLPIPILDGGHMVFLLWEKIRGKAPSQRVQEGALWIGLAALGCFVIFVTFNDVARIFTF
jgi:regulator of sigma E protease